MKLIDKSKSWIKKLGRHNEDSEEGSSRPNRRDNVYEELQRKATLRLVHSNRSNLTTRSSIHSKRPIQRVETTVKLRSISTGGRRVFVNLPLPKFILTKNGNPPKYATNKIRTSKYTILSFFPKNLFEQFRRPANIYFLGMAIIQMLPVFGLDSPALTLLPICTVVSITAAKDAFEDYQRHKVDEQYNQNITHKLKGYKNTNYVEGSNNYNCFSSLFGSSTAAQNEEKQNMIQGCHGDDSNNNHADVFVKSLSKDIHVGDFILLRNGDSLPADAVLLSTSDKEGVCFVETKDLDGETNLKPRQSIKSTRHIQSGADCLSDCHFYIEADSPSPDLYKFQGTLVTLERRRNAHHSQHDDEYIDKYVEKSKTPIEIDNILLRGHVIRNTQWAIAVVLFTGIDTKIMLNSGETPSKRSRVDSQMNQEIYVAFGVLFLLCLISAILGGLLRYKSMQDNSAALFTTNTDSPGYVGFINFFSSLIIFQNIIPISLYVSIEFVKTFQAFFIWSDLDMWDEHLKKTCIPKNWALSDDLGQVEYIFSDKTGTLTRNIMEFRECSIGGVRYGDNGFSPESEGARGARLRREKEERKFSTGTGDLENQSTIVSPSINTPPALVNNEEALLEDEEKKAEEEYKQRKKVIFKKYESELKKVFDPTYSSLDPNRLSFADPQLYKDIHTADMNNNDEQSTRIKEFFMLLALCHTVVIERIDKDGNPIEDEDDDEEEDVNKIEPKVCDEDSSKPSSQDDVNKFIEEKEEAESSKSSSSQSDEDDRKKKGSSKLLHFKVPRLQNLRRTSEKRLKKKNRGEELTAITKEKDTSDRVDSTVKIQLDYKAESPDEAALVNAAKNAGFAFIKRKGKILTVDILGEEYDFELLHVLDFNSDRKRMSVIIRRPAPWNDIVLYCKGADNVIEDRLDKECHQKNLVNSTKKHTNDFSEYGLRTLFTSYRILTETEYQTWEKEMHQASTASEGRSDKIAEAQEKIETKLKLLGATGIEDKLQEGVPQCIESLRKAEIKIWVLTGDKLQTAINIGYASNLLDTEMKLWIIRGSDSSDEVFHSLDDAVEKLDEIEARYAGFNADMPMQENALIIEGSALLHIFESDEAKQQFLNIAIRCKSVVCCRVSPLQKALVVELVRKSEKVITLAVGDGANDVSMIQVANIGVGISGQEGVQASMAADYAICQFRFLHKLLLVQGHWSYARISEMILTFFFKNIFWVLPSLWYQIYSDWSGNIFYDYSFLQLYNVVFTLIPVVVIGATDQDLTAPYLKLLPKVYTIRGKLYTRLKFWIYFLDGVWQSLAVFYAFYFLYAYGNPNSNGYSDSAVQFSTSVAVTALVLANLVPGFNTYYWTWWQFVGIGLEITLVFLWVVLYGLFPTTSLYDVYEMVFGQGNFWLGFVLAIILAFLPRYIITFISQCWYPNVVAKGRQLELADKQAKKRKAKAEGEYKSWTAFSSCFPLKQSSPS